jgi:hypothetical protein
MTLLSIAFAFSVILSIASCDQTADGSPAIKYHKLNHESAHKLKINHTSKVSLRGAEEGISFFAYSFDFKINYLTVSN